MKPLLTTLFVGVVLGLQVAWAADEPPTFGYENLPETGFSCDGKLPGRYYADPETDCQMFHVCVKMSKRDVQDFKFLCPNGTVFDQEHLVCADFYQVACHSNPQSSTFGHIFEFLKLSASKSSLLDYGKVPAHDPEYLGRNTLGGDDFQVEEYNNNKLAAQGNALYNAQNARNKEVKFPTTTTRKAATTTTTTTTTFRPAPTTTAAPVVVPVRPVQTGGRKTIVGPITPVSYEYQPIPATGAPASQFEGPAYQVDSVNFHRETSVPDLLPLPTTTVVPSRRPDQYFSGNFNRNSFATEYNSPTYAPPETTSTTTTRRPQAQVFQSTIKTFIGHPTQRPVQQQTFQQQPTHFSDEYFRRLPTTQQSTTQRIQQLFYGSSTTFAVPATTALPRTFPPPTVAAPVNSHPNYYAVDDELAYIPQGRSVNSDSSRNRFEEAPQILNLPVSTPATVVTSTAAAEVYVPVEETSTTAEPSVATTTTLAPPASLRPGARRGGRRRLNPNRQRVNNNNGAQGGRPRNYDGEFKYARRFETSRQEHRERIQKTEEIFNAEASVYRGEPNNQFSTDDAKPVEVQTSEAPVKKTHTFGGENFGRRIRPNGKPFGSEDGKVITRPDGTKVIKRLRQKSTTEPSTTIAYEVPAFSTTSAPAFKTIRTGVRTKTIVGPITPDSFPSGDGKRRIIVKKLRPKTTTTTVAPTTESTFEPELITSSTEKYSEVSTPADVYTTFKIEEITTAAPPRAFEPQQPTNFSATVGGFKVTVISRSSDSETSTSNAETVESTTSAFQKPKASFPKLNKKLISGQTRQQQSTTTVAPESDGEVGSTKSPDYDYHYFNTDDESQYVAEDRHYGDKRRNKKQVKKVEEPVAV